MSTTLHAFLSVDNFRSAPAWPLTNVMKQKVVKLCVVDWLVLRWPKQTFETCANKVILIFTYINMLLSLGVISALSQGGWSGLVKLP